MLNADAIVGLHAWCDDGMQVRATNRAFFFSDALVARLKQDKAEKGLHLGRVPTSDLPPHPTVMRGDLYADHY